MSFDDFKAALGVSSENAIAFLFKFKSSKLARDVVWKVCIMLMFFIKSLNKKDENDDIILFINTRINEKRGWIVNMIMKSILSQLLKNWEGQTIVITNMVKSLVKLGKKLQKIVDDEIPLSSLLPPYKSIAQQQVQKRIKGFKRVTF